MLDYFVETIPHFLAYFGTAVGLAAAFLWLYSLCTPHPEFALIREGNSAAAVQLTWTFMGFAIPVASVTAHSVDILDMVVWGAVAGAVQLVVFVVISRFLFKSVSARIADGCVASGQFVGGIGLGIGILQAACMVP